MRHGIQALAVLLFFLAVLLATSGHAQVIHACAHKQTGVLRLVGGSTGCGQNESPVSWNQEGPKGEMGDSGEPGEVGPQGPPGPSLRVFDANGTDIGLLVGGVERDTRVFAVLLSNSDILVELSSVDGTLQLSSRPLLFEDPGCPATGVELVTASGGTIGFLFKNGTEPDVRYFISNAEPAREITERSRIETTGLCSDQGPDPRKVVSVTEVPLADLGISFPLPTPLYVAPSIE
jgi:hypothetical protein